MFVVENDSPVFDKPDAQASLQKARNCLQSFAAGLSTKQGTGFLVSPTVRGAEDQSSTAEILSALSNP